MFSITLILTIPVIATGHLCLLSPVQRGGYPDVKNSSLGPEITGSLFRLGLLLVLPVIASGHLCLLSPTQRGGYPDVNSAGANSCFRQTAPCGGIEAGGDDYLEKWEGGQQIFIKWQQNFNHYEIGFPGYMDISYAPYNTSDWQLLAFAPDVYVYAQDYLKNYTTFVVVPNIDCPHCVIRARYASHKPGEGTFYQCSDVTITLSSERKEIEPEPRLMKHKEYRNAMQKFKWYKRPVKDDPVSLELSLRGFGYSPMEDDDTYFVNVTFDGDMKAFNKFNFGVDFNIKSKERLNKRLSVGRRQLLEDAQRKHLDPAHMMFVLDAVTTVNKQNNMLVMFHDDSSMDVPATKLMEIDSQFATILYNSEISNLNGRPINAIMAEDEGLLYTFSVVPNEDLSKGYDFIIGKISPQNGSLFIHYEEILRTGPEPLYVNFQWAELDADNKRMFVLMGNENSPARLKARIYTFDLKELKQSNMVELDVSNYGFMDIRYYRKKDKLYTLSPGLFLLNSYYYEPKCNYTLLEIDPTTGSVTPVFTIANPGDFRCYYGGAIFNGLDQSTGVLYHVLNMPDIGSDVIAMVDIENELTTFSQFTNLKFVHNLALTRNVF